MASHVEIVFRDEYLTRADMWRLVLSELANKVIYKGQKVIFLNTIKASIQTIYIYGKKVQTGYYGSSTKPIFRSESARYVMLLQMSKEMWDFDADGSGEIMFDKVVNGFLPELFGRWQKINAHHLVSIILFTRVVYANVVGESPSALPTSEKALNANASANSSHHKDFFRVVVSDFASGDWTTILRQLKREFKVFARDILIRRPGPGECTSFDRSLTSLGSDSPDYIIAGCPSAAVQGNILEAIDLACSQFSDDNIDRDLVRTGVSVLVITPGAGLFEVDYDMLALTTENLIANGVGIDLVCLSRMPLHSVPLFKYQDHKPRVSHNQARTTKDPEYPRRHRSASTSLQSDIRQKHAPLTLGRDSTPPNYHSGKGGHIERSWIYVVPHWMDVSFWSSPPLKSRKLIISNDTHSSKPEAAARARKPFISRVHMYELEMMGLVEDVTSDVRIPHLRQTHYIQKPVRPQLYTSKHSNRSSPSSVGTVLSTRMKERGTPDARHSTGRDSFQTRQISATQVSGVSVDWMDDYDDIVYQHPLQKGAAFTESQYPWHMSVARSLRTHRPSEIGNSLGQIQHAEVRRPSMGKNMLSPNPTKLNATSNKFVKEAQETNPIAPNSHIARKPNIIKTPRHISFGLRGLGSLVPKAIASIGVSSEYANWVSPVTRSAHTQTFTKASNTALSLHSDLSFPEANDLQQPEPKAAMPTERKTISQMSQPIAIKRTHKDYGSDDGKTSSKTNSVAFATPLPEKHKFWNSEFQDYSISHGSIGAEPSDFRLDYSEPSVQASALAPWLTVLDPSNPQMSKVELAHRLGRWQHVVPRPLRASRMKWKSLCSPAAVPITTEEFPTVDRLVAEYAEKKYTVELRKDNALSDVPKTSSWLFKELIAFRLSCGFQVLVDVRQAEIDGKPTLAHFDAFNETHLSEFGATVYMSGGGMIHRLLLKQSWDVEVTLFMRRPTTSQNAEENRSTPVKYTPFIRTMLAQSYEQKETEMATKPRKIEWSIVDSLITSKEKLQSDDMVGNMRLWSTRFVLIPANPNSNSHNALLPTDGDDEEEIRLEGISKLTKLWQRNRYNALDERAHPQTIPKHEDENALEIQYETRDSSAIVTAELEAALLAENDAIGKPDKFLPDNEKFKRVNFNMVSLAQIIQGDKGVCIKDRGWHFKLHYSCFIGSELTTWLLKHFKDVGSRTEAVELGNELMMAGLFQHVEKRHNFRDGNYFYQLLPEYSNPRVESKGSWFGTRKSDRSVPSTPMSDSRSKMVIRGLRSRSDSNSKSPNAHTPTSTEETKRLIIALSKSLVYNLDPRKRSCRPEVITLHYDQVHNPDNCYHVRIDWMTATSKLIEDAIISWAITAERSGLRLIEVPIAEASSISSTHPFRTPYLVHLVQPPPTNQPSSYFDAGSLSNQNNSVKHFYQKAIMKKFNFILDLEAVTEFPPGVEVNYSWGKPSYRFTQYIHRSGSVLAQITDDGNFLLLENNLYNSHSVGYRENRISDLSLQSDRAIISTKIVLARGSPRSSPASSPVIRATVKVSNDGLPLNPPAASKDTAEKIKNDIKSFCNDAEALSQFYDDVSSKTQQSIDSDTPSMDGSIPTLGLPSSVMLREGSPSPFRIADRARRKSNGSGSPSARATQMAS